MKKFVMVAIIFVLAVLMIVPLAVQADSGDSCYGQVSAVYGALGIQGEHASSFAGEPRIGIRNLARELYDAGILEDDTMTALGIWLNDVLGLEIDACL